MPINERESVGHRLFHESEKIGYLSSSFKDLTPYETHTGLLKKIAVSFHRFYQARKFIDFCHTQIEPVETSLEKVINNTLKDFKDCLHENEFVLDNSNLDTSFFELNDVLFDENQMVFSDSDFTEDRFLSRLQEYRHQTSLIIELYTEKAEEIKRHKAQKLQKLNQIKLKQSEEIEQCKKQLEKQEFEFDYVNDQLESAKKNNASISRNINICLYIFISCCFAFALGMKFISESSDSRIIFGVVCHFIAISLLLIILYFVGIKNNTQQELNSVQGRWSKEKLLLDDVKSKFSKLKDEEQQLMLSSTALDQSAFFYKFWLKQLSDLRMNVRDSKASILLLLHVSAERLSRCYTDFIHSLADAVNQAPECYRFLNYERGHSAPEAISHSHQIIAAWNDPRWWHSVENGYLPRLEGIAPPFLQLGTIAKIQTFHYDNSECPSVSLGKFDEFNNIRGDFHHFSGAKTLELDFSLLRNHPFLINCLTFQSDDFAQYRGHTVIFSNSDSTRRAATEALESIALRAFATFPVRKLQGIFVDPISMGNTFPFKSLPEELRGKRTYTTSSDIQEELLKLITHTEQMIQNYLSRDYASIEEYNAAAEAIQEAYRYLFVADFPSKFDSRSLEYLNSLLTNGARAGVYAIIHIDETLEKPRNFNYDLFKDNCNVLRPTGEFYEGQPLFRYEAYNGLRYEVTLDKPPANDKFNCLTSLITDACSKVKVDTVPFTKLYPLDFWLEDSRKELRAPIGLSGARDRLEFWLGQNSSGQEISQSLLFGKPGAGKSFTLHSIINSLAMRYAPDELELYLLDYKEGVEFQIYVDPDRGETGNPNDELSTERALPHAKVISIESDREFGLSVLRKINGEFKRRADRWKAVANDITKVAEFRDRTHEKMPRILVVIDEFQVLFEDNDAISMEINQIFNTIIKQGRAYGVHLLLASQSPNIKNISRSVYDLIDLRMAMQMNQNIAAMALAEGNLDAIDLLDRPGRIIYNTDFGRKGSNQLGQVADVNPDERKQALRAIQRAASEQNYHRPESDPLVLFDGRHPTRLRNNSALTALAKAPHWLASAEIKALIQEPSWRTKQYPSVAWLGEAMRIGDHSRAIFRRQLSSNLLIVGQDAEDSYGILSGTLTSLACCHQPHKAQFYIADMADEEDPSLYWSSLTTDFRNTFELFFDIQVAKDFPDKERNITTTATLLQNIYTEFERRKQLRHDDPDGYDFGPSVFLVCAFGTLDCLSNLRPVPGRRGDPEMSDDAKKLLDMAAQGAELGIHLVLYIENLKVFNQLFSTKERAALNHFGLRVALAMPADDSRTLLGENIAANLPKLRAYFKNVAASSQLDKLKPYAMPTQTELSQYGQWLQQKN